MSVTQRVKHFGVNDAPPEGEWLPYRKKTVVRMIKMTEPFQCSNREGRMLHGKAGDFLAMDGYGGYYPIGPEFHAANYEIAEDS